MSLYGKKSKSAKIILHPDLSPSELSACISQLFSKELSKNAIDAVHGLYDNEGLFVPLSHVISSLTDEDAGSDVQSLSILPSFSSPPPPKKSSLSDPYIIVGSSLAFVLAFAVGLVEKLVSWTVTVPIHLFDVVIETPVKQFYRYGPSVFGWEGLTYPEICARITYHGDQLFWSKNLDECYKIFAAKEAAVLMVCKPLMYLVIFGVGVKLAHAFVKASARSKPDPDMVATFKAFKTLSKQMVKK